MTLTQNEKKTLNGKQVLITGAAGFIGSHLTKRLLIEGAKVHTLLLKDADIFRIKDIFSNLNVKYIDIRDYESIRKYIREIKPQLIFHLAALRDVSRELRLIDEMIDTNVKGTVNLLKAIIEEKIPIEYFINTGSCEEYGNGITPFSETNKEIPVSPYSASKVASTYICNMLFRTYNIPIVTIRPFLTYGPSQDPDMFIPSLIIHCLKNKNFNMTDGYQTREFNYIDDIISAYIIAAKSSKIAGEIFNIGNGVEYSVKEVACKIVRKMNTGIKLNFGSIPTRPGEAEHFYCDNQKARLMLGWTPSVNLEDGLQKTIEWYRCFYRF